MLQSRGLREEILINMAERCDCTDCKESLYGKKYILQEDDPYCIKCYEALFSYNCEGCQKLIGCTSKVIFSMSHKPSFVALSPKTKCTLHINQHEGFFKM